MAMRAMRGARSNRPELAKVLKRLDTGDVLIVTRLDRLARSTRDLLNILHDIAQRGAGFKSLHDAWADTTSAHGRLMVTILAGLAEFERELILARTSDGRARAKARGIKFGRPAALTPHQRSEALQACQWRSTGRRCTELQCLTGDHLTACGSVTKMTLRVTEVSAYFVTSQFMAMRCD
jgi:DNA invertase Pin-like site-specific DNA recombinase